MPTGTDLEVRARHGLGQLSEKRLLHLGELGGVHHFEYVLHLIQIHDFLCAVRFRPVAQQTKNNLDARVSIGMRQEARSKKAAHILR